MTGYEAVAEQLARLGVKDVFTFTAKDICLLVSAMSVRGITVHHTRHENGAIGAADGYSRVSGRVGVAIVGQGVGITNCMNALITASKAHSQVLVLAGEVPGAESRVAKLQRKYIDQVGMLDSLSIRHVDFRHLDSVGSDITVCYEFAQRGGEALVVNLPDEILDGTATDGPARVSLPMPPGAALSDEDRDTIVGLLEEGWAAKSTVILAGRGAVKAGAGPDLLRLATATGALLGTTVMAKGMFEGSPYSVGVVGSLSSSVTSELLRSASLVLAFGTSLSYETTYDGTIFGKARFVHVDNQADALQVFQRVDLGVVADARLAAAALADALEKKGHRSVGYHNPEVARQIAAYRPEDSFSDRTSVKGGIDGRTLMIELNKRLPKERTVVVDSGNHMYYPIRYLAVPDEAGFVWPVAYASLGSGLGNALGAAVARRDRLTVLCVGDGGMMMTLADLDTAARYKLPLLVVVNNNSALLSELHYLVDHGFTGDDARYENPSFEAVARGLGYEAATIRTIADLDAVLPTLKTLRGPMLLDCITTQDVLGDRVPNFARERIKKGAAEMAGAAR